MQQEMAGMVVPVETAALAAPAGLVVRAAMAVMAETAPTPATMVTAIRMAEPAGMAEAAEAAGMAESPGMGVLVAPAGQVAKLDREGLLVQAVLASPARVCGSGIREQSLAATAAWQPSQGLRVRPERMAQLVWRASAGLMATQATVATVVMALTA